MWQPLALANTMMMSIYERTKEIGIIKVLGCDMKVIRNMFLLESGFIGFMGGVVGLLFSEAVSFAINRLLNIGQSMTGMSGDISRIPLWLAAASLAFAVFIGMAAGFLPGSESHEVKSAGSHPQRVRVIRTWHEFTMCQLETACVQQKILAFSARIRYPVYRACDWRKKWGTTGEHVY